MINFKGDKAELHAWRKEWCEINDRTINRTILESIKNYKEFYDPRYNKTNQ